MTAMDLVKLTAIIRNEKLDAVETVLQEMRVPGISVTKVKGYGEYANFYTRDWMLTHARVEIFTEAGKGEAIAEAIVKTACVGAPGDGIVAIIPVRKMYRIRTQSEVTADEI